MRYLTLDIHGEFTAVLDRGEMEVLIYDPRFKGDDPRGSRQQDMWTADGQFVTSALSGILIQRGDHPWNMVGHIDRWTMNAHHFRYLRLWLRGVVSEGQFPTGDGQSFINNRWVYTGPAGYRVRKRDDGMFNVVSYTANSERVCGPFALGLDMNAAYALAATLAGGR